MYILYVNNNTYTRTHQYVHAYVKVYVYVHVFIHASSRLAYPGLL